MPERVTIHAIAHGGEGIGRVAGDSKLWFVDGGLPGDTLLAEPLLQKPRMIRGRVIEVIEASPMRVEPPCGLAGRCGGCGWQHVRPPAQSELKRQIVADLLRKISTPAIRVVASPMALGYRRRARLHFERGADGSLRLGFFGRSGRAVVDAPDCLVLDAALRHAIARVREVGELLPAQGELHVLSDGARAIVGFASSTDLLGQRVPLPPLVGDAAELRARLGGLLDEVLVGVTVAGARGLAVGVEALELDAAGPEDMSVRTGAFGFAQAQSAQNAALVAHVLRHADPGRRGKGLELYAGAGNFTRGLARKLRALTAVEMDAGGAAALQQLAARMDVLGVGRLEVLRESAATVLARMARGGLRFDVVVLDPPRAGLGTGPARDLAQLALGRTIYVSCDPATLARDLAALTGAGHKVIDVTVFDLMPMTPEVEVVAVLEANPRRPT